VSLVPVVVVCPIGAQCGHGINITQFQFSQPSVLGDQSCYNNKGVVCDIVLNLEDPYSALLYDSACFSFKVLSTLNIDMGVIYLWRDKFLMPTLDVAQVFVPGSFLAGCEPREHRFIEYQFI